MMLPALPLQSRGTELIISPVVGAEKNAEAYTAQRQSPHDARSRRAQRLEGREYQTGA
jgi:hypothetical protein